MDGAKNLEILSRIVLMVLIGIYLLNNQDTAFVKAFSRDKYDPQKVTYLLAASCFGIAISGIPSLLSVVFQKKWLNAISVTLLLIVIIATDIYESKGKLK